MKLEKLAAIGEIVSSIAIVATLAYLAVQTKQTNSALFANSRAQIMQADLALVLDAANSPYTDGMREAVQFALRRGEQLTEEEVQDLWRSYNILAGFTRVREFAWFQYQDGLLDERAWDGCLATLVRNLSNETGRALWEDIKSEMDPEFVAHIDARLAGQRSAE